LVLSCVFSRRSWSSIMMRLFSSSCTRNSFSWRSYFLALAAASRWRRCSASSSDSSSRTWKNVSIADSWKALTLAADRSCSLTLSDVS
jgi:hypothetical protein